MATCELGEVYLAAVSLSNWVPHLRTESTGHIKPSEKQSEEGRRVEELYWEQIDGWFHIWSRR